MTKTIKVFGPPGTGKTTFIVNGIEELMNSNWNIEDICYCTFTKAGATEGAQRMMTKFGISTKPAWFSTIHSISYRLLGLRRDNVALEAEREEFAKQLGQEYKSAIDLDAADGPSFMHSTPNQEWTRLNIMLDFEERVRNIHQVKPADIDLAFLNNLWVNLWPRYMHSPFASNSFDIMEVQKVCKQWEEWKAAHAKLDFTDMLMEVLHDNLVVPTRALYVDEFQDLTPLQNSVIELWEKRKELVVIAGDDDQTIYDWAGASPRYLIEKKADETIVLPKSHRMPAIIKEYVDCFIRQNRLRQPKIYQASRTGGFVGFTLEPLQNLRGDRSTLFLFRTNWQATQWRDRLIEAGIPFKTTRGGQIWTERLVELLKILCMKLEPTMPLPSNNILRRFVLELPTAYLARGVKTRLRTGQSKDMPATLWDATLGAKENLWVLVNDPASLKTILLSRVKSKTQKRALEKRLPIGPIDAFKLEIGTIHSRKGGEAEDAFVFTELSKRMLRQLATGDTKLVEAERRVFYVGMSRPKERLWVVPNPGQDARFLWPKELWRNFG